MKNFLLLWLLSQGAMAQVEIQNQSGSVQAGRDQGVHIQGQAGSVQASPDGVVQINGAGGNTVRLVNSKGLGSRRRAVQSSVEYGPRGELIVTDGRRGTRIVIEKGQQGLTRIESARGNYTVPNSLVRQVLQGADPEQLLLQHLGSP